MIAPHLPVQLFELSDEERAPVEGGMRRRRDYRRAPGGERLGRWAGADPEVDGVLGDVTDDDRAAVAALNAAHHPPHQDRAR